MKKRRMGRGSFTSTSMASVELSCTLSLRRVVISFLSFWWMVSMLSSGVKCRNASASWAPSVNFFFMVKAAVISLRI